MNAGSQKILVVDDDYTIRDIVSTMLGLLGYEVLSADSGEQGLALFIKNKFDLVITDFNMSGMDESPSTPVVLMTGNGKDVSLSRIRDTAVDQALFKPFTLAEMDITVQGLLHS
jgi:CheY-like chemotaxis protein